MSGNYNVPKLIDYVQGKIESCIQNYMTLEQTLTHLEENHQIPRLIGTPIWEKLQSENPIFFKEYYKRCEVARQIVIFNDLLSQQIDLMNKYKINITTTAPVTELQKPSSDLHDHEDGFAEWVMFNEFVDIEEPASCIINSPSLFDATPPQSNPSTWFNETPQSDPLESFDATPQSDLRTNGLRFGPGVDDLDSWVQYSTETEEQQRRLELKFEKNHQPQPFMEKQEEYFPQGHESTKLVMQEELFITKQKSARTHLDFGDGPINKNGSAQTRENNK